jgi:hypothetical protein
MATALNVFKTVTADLTTEERLLYTAPTRKTSIFLSVQATNITNTTTQVSFYHGSTNVTGNVKTAMAKNFKIPAGDSMAVISAGAKLVLETGQKVYSSASANNTVQLVMSVLESAND